ncbi:hypothetical protein CO168_00635 [Candidatus Shapirobacteria bacterium CG_4_9_14_3_um_filter_36_12]|uniref:Glycosyl transferase family 1 domain-containing protein n=2 Tax=Candidatus Shapironibacteriota TaxID=1752721 RepID=A0A2M7XPF3_9BACT|nr:MAG: hypothetical protein CO168_00635 [Candidatus Shapirobacteria bacterium CG_4_9_14_3_um_filter_36_12]
MKIAIFHNLKNGGGLQYIASLIKELSKQNITTDIYTHQDIFIPKANKIYFYPLKNTNNIFHHVKQVLYETEKIEHAISINIIMNKYDYVFVFPCHLQQCPNLIKFLPKNNTYYFYLESLREFYEKTSFDYYNLKKILSRLIRIPIKIQDHINCLKTKNIITDSYYSNYQLNKIYNKKSNVIYPGMVNCVPKKIIVINKHKSLSFGLLSMLKGHQISAQIDSKIDIIGSKSHEEISNHIAKNIYINDTSINNTNKTNMYKNYTFYFANQINEPFGLTTLEATSHNCFVMGRNEAGTCEIINNGNNGLLYNAGNIELAKKIYNKIKQNNTLLINKTTKISWKETVNKIFFIITHAQHHPHPPHQK